MFRIVSCIFIFLFLTGFAFASHIEDNEKQRYIIHRRASKPYEPIEELLVYASSILGGAVCIMNGGIVQGMVSGTYIGEGIVALKRMILRQTTHVDIPQRIDNGIYLQAANLMIYRTEDENIENIRNNLGVSREDAQKVYNAVIDLDIEE